jgi:hypothetical protein
LDFRSIARYSIVVEKVQYKRSAAHVCAQGLYSPTFPSAVILMCH